MCQQEKENAVELLLKEFCLLRLDFNRGGGLRPASLQNTPVRNRGRQRKVFPSYPLDSLSSDLKGEFLPYKHHFDPHKVNFKPEYDSGA